MSKTVPCRWVTFRMPPAKGYKNKQDTRAASAISKRRGSSAPRQHTKPAPSLRHHPKDTALLRAAVEAFALDLHLQGANGQCKASGAKCKLGRPPAGTASTPTPDAAMATLPAGHKGTAPVSELASLPRVSITHAGTCLGLLKLA